MGVLLPTVMIMVELPAPGAGMVGGLKVTVVPLGTPDVDKLMELLKPPLMTVVMVELPWLPCAMLREEGEAEMVKLGGANACVTPRKAIGVTSPVELLVPTSTVNCVPVNVTCCVTLLLGQSDADQIFPCAS